MNNGIKNEVGSPVSNKINIEYWQRLLDHEKEEDFFVWMDAIENNENVTIEEVFTFDEKWLEKIEAMTKTSGFLIQNFFTIVTGNALRRYLGKSKISIISPSVSDPIAGYAGTYNIHQLDTDNSLTFKEQFVLNKAKITKAFDLNLTRDQLNDLEERLCWGVSIEHVNERWEEGIKPDFCIDWIIEKGQQGVKVSCSNTSLDRGLIRILGANLISTLGAFINAPYTAIKEMDLRSEIEKKFIQKVARSYEAKLSKSTIVSAFEKTVEMYPNDIAISAGFKVITYQELNENSNQLACALENEYSIGKEDLVGVILERGPEMMMSILAIWKLGAAYIPIESTYPSDRIGQMIENAELTYVIGNEVNNEVIRAFPVTLIDFSTLNIAAHKYEKNNLERAIKPSDLAYIIYTSGSTGKPKGVMIEHLGMLNHIKGKITDLGMNQHTRLAQNAPHGFDISVWQMFAPLILGGTTVIYENDVVYNCDLFVDKLNEDNITLLELVPSYLTEMLLNLKEKQSESYYQQLTSVVLNAEPLLPWMVADWLALFPNIPIYNTYGITEVSDDISHYRIEKPQNFRSVPVLKGTISNAQINLVNAEFEPVPPGAVGEILVSGMSVGSGYLNDNIRTKAVFLEGPIENVTLEKRVYKTGDLARFISDGSLEFVGRVDKQVKINGQRVELGAVEHVIAALENITNAAVLPNANKTFLVAFYTGKNWSKEALIQAITEKLPKYMIPHEFVYMEKLPLSDNGKILRSKLPIEQFENLQSAQAFVEPVTPTEVLLAEFWKNTLVKERIGRLDDFFGLGGHSLKMMSLFGKINKQFKKSVSLKDLFENTTLQEQALIIDQAEVTDFEEIPQLEKQARYELSSGQERLWILSQVPEINLSYSMPAFLQYEADLNVKALEKSIAMVVQRHEALRTLFELDENGKVWQRIVENEGFEYNLPVEYVFASNGENINEVINRKQLIPFDLEKGPLFRTELLKEENGTFVFFFNVHHIISDGWSEEVLMHEIGENYKMFIAGKSPVIAPLRIQYKDFAAWQIAEMQRPNFLKSKKYWAEKLSGTLPILDFPTDKPRPRNKTFNGRSLKIWINEKDTDQMRAYCQQHGGSLFVGMLSVWNVLSYRYSGQSDIIVGTPVTGRKHPDLENQVGFYVNTLPIRTEFEPSSSFSKLFDLVKESIISGYENDAWPFDQIVEDLNLSRSISRSPIFDVMMIFQNKDENLNASMEYVSGLRDLGARIPKFDLDIIVQEFDKTISLEITFNEDVYDQTMVIALLNHYSNLVKVLPAAASQEISTVEYLSIDEKEQILTTFNDTFFEKDQNETLVRLFEKQVAREPNNTAIIHADKQLTYLQLNEAVNRLAKILIKEYDLRPADIVGIKIQRTEWMMVAYLAVMKIAATYVPIDYALPTERIEYIENNAGCKVIIDDHLLLGLIDASKDFSPENLNLKIEPNQVVYIIYTSGSTGKPKGVRVTNSALTNFVTWSIRTYNFNSNDRVGKHLNMAFDASVEEVYPTLLSGSTLDLMPDGILLDLEKLNQYVETNGLSVIAIPPTLLDSFYEFNNKSLRLILLGGGKIRNYLDKGIVIANHYGPTEATVTCLSHVVNKDEKQIPIGKPIDNVQVYILDNNQQLCPLGVRGEICISGQGLALGYLNEPELTNEKFITNPFVEGEKLYRTGDIGKWRANGDIEFIGRVDDQVKVRGYRIELDEIRSVLKGEEDIVNAIVEVVEDGLGENEIVAYFVGNSPKKRTQLRQFLKLRLPEYMIPSYFVQLDEIPLTQNGKIDRSKLPDYKAIALGGDELMAPKNRIETELLEIWKAVLNNDHIGVVDDFFEVGGHSLKLATLNSRINSQFQVAIELKDLFQKVTVREQANLIASAENVENEIIQSIPVSDKYRASYAQKRLWYLSKLLNGNLAYNMPESRQLTGNVNSEALENALLKVIQRHEILRTVFQHDNSGAIYQIVLPETGFDFKLKKVELLGKSDDEIIAYLDHLNTLVFDLENGPLIRAELIQIKPETYIFYFNVHHIISDGWSMEVLSQEIMSHYNALIKNTEFIQEPLRIQYKDYSEWEYKRIAEDARIKGYWLDQFKEETTPLSIPTSYPRPPIRTYNGASYSGVLAKESFKAFKQLLNVNQVTLFMGLLGLVNTLFYRYSGQSDIVIGTPIAGRHNVDLENQIGLYANILPLRTKISGDAPFNNLMKTVKEVTVGAYSNQELPFDQLVEELDLTRDTSRTPLFDHMIVLQNIDIEGKEGQQLGDLSVQSGLSGATRVSKFDLTLNFREDKDHLTVTIEYNVDLYEEVAMQRLVAHIDTLMSAIIANPELELNKLNYLTKAERAELLAELNSETEIISAPNLIDKFEAHVQNAPENNAVIFKDQILSYTQLNQRANKLAHCLIEQKGIEKGDRVGLFLDRTPRMVAAILAVLKCAAVYVPVANALPEERKKFIASDAGLKFIIDEDFLTNFEKEKSAYSNENLEIKRQGTDLAYVIYTSGTTGLPKGVPINHAAIANTVDWKIKTANYKASTIGLHFVSFSFDVSVEEMFSFLNSGGSFVLLEEHQKMKFESIRDLIVSFKVNAFTSLPAFFLPLYAHFPEVLNGMRVLALGGESINTSWINQVLEQHPQLNMIIQYGLTEAAVTSTALTVDKTTKFNTNITSIGRAITHNQAYILDENLQLVTKGVIGQIAIAGIGLSEGYWERPDLNSQRFIQHPFDKTQKMFLTGDLGCHLENGEILFRGRNDDQVKVRGNRIELGEIESALLKEEHIDKVFVTTFSQNGERDLVAYYTSQKELLTSEILANLKRTLPAYMVPPYIVQLESFPVSRNDKIDKRKLPNPLSVDNWSGREYVAPENDTEASLQKIWGEVLLRSNISVLDSFFEIGGNSIKIVHLSTLVNNHFDRNDEVIEFFQYPTIRSFASFIGEKSTHNQVFEEVVFEDAMSSMEDSLSAFNTMEDEEE